MGLRQRVQHAPHRTFEPFLRTGFGFDVFWFQLFRSFCHMKSAAVRKAKHRLERARASLTELEKPPTTYADAETAWTDFLLESVRKVHEG